MEKILAPIKNRILQLIENKGINKKKFFDSIGVAASNFRSNALKSEVGGDVIAKILAKYDDVNPEWLLMGKGEILKDPYKKSEVEDYKELAEARKKIIGLMEKDIHRLERKITKLKKAKEPESPYRNVAEPDH